MKSVFSGEISRGIFLTGGFLKNVNEMIKKLKEDIKNLHNKTNEIINEINFELYCALQEKDIPIVSFRLNILLL